MMGFVGRTPPGLVDAIQTTSNGYHRLHRRMVFLGISLTYIVANHYGAGHQTMHTNALGLITAGYNAEHLRGPHAETKVYAAASACQT